MSNVLTHRDTFWFDRIDGRRLSQNSPECQMLANLCDIVVITELKHHVPRGRTGLSISLTREINGEWFDEAYRLYVKDDTPENMISSIIEWVEQEKKGFLCSIQGASGVGPEWINGNDKELLEDVLTYQRKWQ